MKYAHPRGVSVEGELGVLAGVEDHVFAASSTYTNPLSAVDFVRKTKVDALAISYGTMHGPSKGKDVKLRREIPIAVRECLAHEGLDCALVSHGSSTVPRYIVDEINELGGNIQNAYGISLTELKAAIPAGINKINIDTDIRLAVTRNMRELFAKHPELQKSESIGGVYKLLLEHPENPDPRAFLRRCSTPSCMASWRTTTARRSWPPSKRASRRPSPRSSSSLAALARPPRSRSPRLPRWPSATRRPGSSMATQDALLVVHGGGSHRGHQRIALRSGRRGAQDPRRRTGAGALGGMGGITDGTFVDFAQVSPEKLSLLPSSPSSAIGTSRKPLEADDYRDLAHALERAGVRWLLPTGGNGTMNTCGEIWRACQAEGVSIDVVGIPKTMDNDIAVTDHAPGYASAALYMAASVSEVCCDVRGLPSTSSS